MAIALLYFARVREAIGRAEESVSPPPEIATLADLMDWLAARGAPYDAALLDRDRLRAAIDQRFAPFDSPIAGAREIAIFPPVTGG